MVGQLEGGRCLHSYGNRTAPISNSADSLEKAGNRMPSAVLCIGVAGLCLRIDCCVLGGSNGSWEEYR